MDVLLVLFAVTVGVVAVVVAFLRQPDPLLRARALKRIGASVMAAFTLLAGVFVVGETFTDPGGTGAIVLVLAWVVPLVALAALAWLRPSWAMPVFVVLTAALIGVSIWFAVDPEGCCVGVSRTRGSGIGVPRQPLCRAQAVTLAGRDGRVDRERIPSKQRGRTGCWPSSSLPHSARSRSSPSATV